MVEVERSRESAHSYLKDFCTCAELWRMLEGKHYGTVDRVHLLVEAFIYRATRMVKSSMVTRVVWI